MRTAPGWPVALLLLAGCGLPDAGEPTAVPATAVPYDLLSPAPSPTSSEVPRTPAPSPTARALPVVWLVDADDVLVPSPPQRAGLLPDALEARASAVLADLQDGPSADERAAGLTSALPSAATLQLASVEGGVASVEVELPDGAPTAERLPLAVGQVVLTLTSVDGVAAVQLLSDGSPLEVPLPDGARAARPLTGSDYAGLTAPEGTGAASTGAGSGALSTP